MFWIPPQRMEDACTEESPEAFLAAHAKGGEMIRPFVQIAFGQPLAGFLDDALGSDRVAARVGHDLHPCHGFKSGKTC